MGRGLALLHKRSGSKPQLPNEATGQTATVPAPYGGWNAAGNLSNMPPLDAVLMDNIFPGVADVTLRKGSVSWVTGFSSPLKTLMPYRAALGSKLFVSTETAVYNVTTSGNVPSPEFSCTKGTWKFVNFANAGGNWLTAVNGTDYLQLYDGTTWTTITDVSTPAITGISTDSFSYVSMFKKRLWFTEKDSLNLWYLPVDSIAGTATKFPVGSLFNLGGYIAATGNWTVDGGSGADDYFVILTSNGQAAVYQGTDPASSATWALVGVYHVGTPVGDSPLQDFGGDLLVMTTAGMFPVSKFLQSTILDRSSAISFKIQGAYLDYVEAYKFFPNWSMTVFPEGNMLLVNIPTGVYTSSEQFVMNLTTKAWCRFLGWNANCFAVVNGTLYFADSNSVKVGWTGTSDDGFEITGDVIQAYNAYGISGQKTVTMVRPHVVFSGNATSTVTLDTDGVWDTTLWDSSTWVTGSLKVWASFDVDFKRSPGFTDVLYTRSSQDGLWDASLWDIALWASSETPVKPTWIEVPNDLGFLHAFRIRVIASTATFKWTANNYLMRPAGVL